MPRSSSAGKLLWNVEYDMTRFAMSHSLLSAVYISVATDVVMYLTNFILFYQNYPEEFVATFMLVRVELVRKPEL